jgi:hypothetical protein
MDPAESHTRNTALPARAYQDPGPLHLNIMAVPCLSVLHVTQEDKEQTERGDYQPGVLGVLDFGCGVLLHIGEDEPTAEDWPGYSAAFVALLQWVQSRGYCYLRLDYDAETLPGVPVFQHDDFTPAARAKRYRLTIYWRQSYPPSVAVKRWTRRIDAQRWKELCLEICGKDQDGNPYTRATLEPLPDDAS